MKCVEQSFDTFHYIFCSYFNKHFPFKRSWERKGKHWVNEEVRLSSGYLKDLYELNKVFPDLKNLYLQAKKKHSMLIKNTKKSFYQNLISESNNNTKALWSVVNQLSNRNNVNRNLRIKHDNNTVSDHKDIAKKFNKFFVETVYNLRNNIPKIDYNDKIGIFRDSMFLFPFTHEELHRLIKRKLKSKKSCGVDDVSSFLVLLSLDHICKPLVHIVNFSFEQAIFPNTLKINKIIPVYKKGDPEDLKNYRPIALSSVFSKILEYAFLERLLPFLDKHDILVKNQFGFRPKRCTIDAIYEFLKDVVDYIESGTCPVGIFCDLSRAFDCVDRNILLGKLYKYGLRGNPLNWISSFLTDRRQYVSVMPFGESSHCDVRSEIINNDVGVPQGSILGPILFILYINDIMNAVEDKVYLYADDATVIITSKTETTLGDNIQSSLNLLRRWFNMNFLHINESKTTFTIFRNINKNIDEINVKLNNMK